MAGRGEPSAVRLADLLGILSFGVDLGMGQPMDHVLRQCLIASALSDRAGLERTDRDAVFYASLVAWVGCHVDAYEQAKWFGDDIALRGDFRRTDLSGPAARPLFMLRHLGRGRTVLGRMAMVPAFLREGRPVAEALLENHWLAADDLMVRIGLDRRVRDTVRQSFERWDGQGAPEGLRGEEILITARLVNLADVVEVFHRSGGVGGAVAVARQRAGTQFDPRLVEMFAGVAERLFADIDASPAWDAVVGAQPAAGRWLAGPELDTGLEAIADFADVKSPYTIGHSRGVADVVAAAGPAYGLADDEVTLVRRAALVHDVGQMGVENTAWDKPGKLTPSETERIRLHAYLTERMLASSQALAPLGAVAGQHHERLDGSGYPRAARGDDITPAGRLLAVADCYHACLEPRPHRAALAPDQAARELRADARAGRLDGQAVEAVLAASGHRPRKRREWPAGLTSREVDILRLVARGLSNKDIAAELAISPKTASSHIEHIYTKLGVTNRALASLYAARHGLLVQTRAGADVG